MDTITKKRPSLNRHLRGSGRLFFLKNPSQKEFRKICLLINEFELDNRDLKKEQFTVAIHEGELVGFGRLREHADCYELCSLGVIPSFRKKGIGKAIVNRLIEPDSYRGSKNIYLVCIIPEYFKPFGFQSVKKCPASVKDKIEYCTSELKVPEKYLAMVMQKNS